MLWSKVVAHRGPGLVFVSVMSILFTRFIVELSSSSPVAAKIITCRERVSLVLSSERAFSSVLHLQYSFFLFCCNRAVTMALQRVQQS